MAAQTFIYLASQSPRRRELLQQIGVSFRVLQADIDESRRPGELASDYVARLAQEKARAAQGVLQTHTLVGAPILAADTCVALGRRLFGKPGGAEEAERILRSLSGRTHRVMTAVALLHKNKLRIKTATTKVRFKQLSGAEILHYIASGEAQDKAGAYAIQGLASAFVAHIEGSYSNVVGLPLYETAALLKSAGMPVL